MGRIGMIEARGELGLAHEALKDDVVATESLVEHLDDGLATEEWLLAAVHCAESALVDSLAKDKLADHATAEVFAFPHPVPTLSPRAERDQRNK
jgi:hypothetical protein